MTCARQLVMWLVLGIGGLMWTGAQAYRIPPRQAVPDSLPSGAARPSSGLVLAFPEENAQGATDILEFRARKGGVTHAFIALGKRLSGGSIYFYGAAGFYPEKRPSSVNRYQYFKHIVTTGTPGEVVYKMDDISEDATYRVDISPAQAKGIAYLIKSYEEKYYQIPNNYCVTLAKAAADYVGLKYYMPPTNRQATFQVIDLPTSLPFYFVKTLPFLNKGDEPRRQEESNEKWNRQLREERLREYDFFYKDFMTRAIAMAFQDYLKKTAALPPLTSLPSSLGGPASAQEMDGVKTRMGTFILRR